MNAIAPTTTETEHENLQDLLNATADGSAGQYHLEDSTGAVHRVLKSGNVNSTATHANVAEYLDTIIRKNAKKVQLVLDMSDEITSRPTINPPWVFPSMADFWTHFLAGWNAQDALNLYFHPSTVVSTRACRNPMEYEYEMPAGNWNRIWILELMEDLYTSHKISIANLDSAASQIARRKEADERKAEKRSEREETTTNTTTTTTATGNTESIETVDYIWQINKALAVAKKHKNHIGEYIFYWEKKNEKMPIRYNPATGYHALYRKEDGGTEWIVNTDPDVVAQEIDRHRQEAEKRKNKKEFAETVDMWEAFSRTKFAELCAAVSKSKWKRGEYMFKGKNYFVHERLNTTVTPPVSFTPQQYTVSFPGAGETKTTEDHLHISDAIPNADPTVDNLITYLEWHHGIYDSHHDLDREHLLSKIKELKWLMGKKTTYVINGHTYHMWSKRLTGGGKMKYYAEVPAGEHGKTTITALTVEWLYDKIINKVQWGHWHDAEKWAEWHAETKKEGAHESKEHAHDEGHWDHHDEGKKSLYDKAVTGLLGNGLLGKAFIGTKNLIPAPLRNIAAGATKAGVSAGVVWGLLYGGSIAFWSAAAASAIVPAMGITFTVSSILRLLKWNKDRKAGDGHDDGHGGH